MHLNDSDSEESENWTSTCRNDDDVGAAEQLIDSLGGCRPSLTSTVRCTAAAALSHIRCTSEEFLEATLGRDDVYDRIPMHTRSPQIGEQHRRDRGMRLP